MLDAKRGPKPVDPSASPERQLRRNRATKRWSWTGSKKVRDQPVEDRKHGVSIHALLALTRQCELADATRSTVYAPRLVTKPDEQELGLGSD